MKPAKRVIKESTEIGLERDEKGRSILNEITGEIIFSETFPQVYGSCLVLRVKGDKTADGKTIWWQEQAKAPIPALVGNFIRGFYERIDDGGILCLNAYELSNRRKILTRSVQSKLYKFIEEEKNVA